MQSPEPNAYIISSLLYSWATVLFTKTRSRNRNGEELQDDDLFLLPKAERTKVLTSKFEKKWYGELDSCKSKDDGFEQKKLETHFKWSLWSVVRIPMLIGGVFRLLNSLSQLAIPFVLEQILDFVANVSDRPYYEGFFWASLLGVLSLLKAVLEGRYFWQVQRAGWQARSVVSTAVYKKSLRLSAASRQSLSQGQIVNLMQLDAEKLERFAASFHIFWDAVLQIIGYCAIVYFYIDIAVFVGVAVIVVSLPIQMFLVAKLFAYVKKIALATDERVKVTNEALQSMLAVKTGAWEDNFTQRLVEIRQTELQPLRSSLLLRSFMMAYITSIPVFTAVAGLGYYGATTDDVVEAAVLFAALQAFTSLRFPLLQLPLGLSTYTDAKVAQMRLSRFLSLEETPAPSMVNDSEEKKTKEEDDVAIDISQGEFFWSQQNQVKGLSDLFEEKNGKKVPKPKIPLAKQTTVIVETQPASSVLIPEVEIDPSIPALEDINLKIRKGDLIGIVGTVGSGKSTLLSSILGELVQTHGEKRISGSIAYCCQTAWILNDTLKSNIVFTRGECGVDEERYEKVLKVCQLEGDLELLQNGDRTMIGERGINLSGGQAQRVSVARAAYSDAQIVLLDDPISALDPEVGGKLFEQCILGLLKREGRTVVMVTNQLNLLQDCDYVVVLQNPGKLQTLEVQGNGAVNRSPGKIAAQGRFNDLMNQNSEFMALMESFRGHRSENEEIEVAKVAEEGGKRSKKDEKDGKLMQIEERQVGAVRFSYYYRYFRRGSIFLTFIAILFLIIGMGASLLNTFIVSFWADDPFYEENSLAFYLSAYAISAVVSAVFAFAQTFLFYVVALNASRGFHKELLAGVFRAPMSFFDTTPKGRIVSRFSRDLFSLDTELPPNLVLFFYMFGSAFFSLVAVVTQLVIFLSVIPFMVLFYLLLMSYYRPTARDCKRLESLSRSPLYAHFSETLNGLSSIRAYGQVNEFMRKCNRHVDNTLKTTYAVRVIERWLSVRLDIIGALVTLSVALLIVWAADKKNLSAGLAGVILSLIMGFTTVLGGMVRTFVLVETSMNSVERISHYAYNLPKEASWRSSQPPVPEWPTSGEIVFSNVQMRYRPETPLVLKGVDAVIPGKSTCGIVGRTGCGKSSLMMSLMRIVELEAGSISIDGTDISQIGLHELRKKISIVPQSPVMFSGTVRLNLDPFNLYNDSELWQALSQVNLADTVKALPKQLVSDVAEYGANFSQGQRQLMCMARSLLQNSKILLLDEATSSVDYETDAIIQATVREGFRNSTILTIAHRIQTVADYDNILVMREGLVAEFGRPLELLKNPSSEFSKIVAELGTQMENKIRNLVATKSIE